MPLKCFFLLLLFVIKPRVGSAELFNFYFTHTRKTSHVSETLCQSLSYDGLAVVSSPEMLRHALKLTQAYRDCGHQRGIFVGLRNDSNTHLVTWDDGSLPAKDTPSILGSLGELNFASKQYGNIHCSGKLRANPGGKIKRALCGNHFNLPTEAHGVSKPYQKADGVSSNLSVTKVFSYLECALLCGQDHRCRAAVFNSDLLTCMTLGPNSYAGLIESSEHMTFYDDDDDDDDDDHHHHHNCDHAYNYDDDDDDDDNYSYDDDDDD
ncbi:hypothetical protein ElyMa_000324900 [Elysia marginata]|uniref:Apple domain-containing protein n=1 Tax=Elysia marginata TaxID=1093978 RepID=A0AAV4FBD9_9GAST|nr:hypothetical protein ElyMa_000324900 [Elysia marginata]